ncbi:hypothetical protein V5N11_005118 [Cardamine amara subsp. amara]|uniref:Reverse transcriptase zinc-binding domain-containing protein n=1 Tax=Cardamine amara subsp. amara TaxID=228776 RepID=A0ABD0ZCE9_CARAN
MVGASPPKGRDTNRFNRLRVVSYGHLCHILLMSRIPIYIWKTWDRPAGLFSSKLTWESLRPRAPIVPWNNQVWYAGHVPKHAFTFWVATLDRLPVRARLYAWGVANSDACCTCGNHFETRDHLLL